MKIKCEKCGKDLSIDVDQKFEQFLVGRIECPNCHKKQSRYLTQLDFSIYLSISSVAYLIVAYTMMNMIDTTGFKWMSIGVLFILYIIVYIILKSIDRLIYNKGFFKSKWMNNEIYEDPKKVRKTLRIEYALYVSLVFFLGTGSYEIPVFVAVILGFSALLIVKTIFVYRKEKTSIKL